MSGKRAAEGGDKNPARAKKSLGEGGLTEEGLDELLSAPFDDDAPVAQHVGTPRRVRCRHGEIPDMCVPCLTQQRQDVEKKLDVARRRKNSAWTSTHKCDGCDVFRPRGIRYVCTECDNTDFCQKCVDEDVHMEHALIQIKYAHQHIGERRRASYGDDGWVRLQ